MYISDRRLLVVGIDHGFSMMKTPHATFENGVEKLGGEATLTNNTLIYQGNYYKVGEGRLPLMQTKTEDENYFLLTLAAVAKEMDIYQQHSADVILAVGLPFSRFGKEKEDFYYYLLREDSIQFNYCGRDYEIQILDVYVFPQCYAAIADKLREYGRENLIIDIGSKTIDVIHTRNYVPVESESTSIPAALIQCMEGIKSNVYQNCNRRVSEDMIQQMILEKDVNIPTDCKVIIRAGLADFAKGIEAKLAELGFDLEMLTVIYAGGGAMLMKNYGTLKGANIHYLEDIRANAKGYEFLAKQKGKF
ncbi:plasmid segregation actin-type ATPase ParM [Kineothrix alysoides]|uniref:Plasmid segregation actin-type ATPase ParM n=1 Tax=Kineothrix alysoides TaxID=1469948 RepID=A0A4R1R6L2_9FIRM|nr:ParM/StbA family protein [Kineothrix alysoides]TCL61140.1 plasmid segregation actin-type ATPase ParM [Kineothrix alysoides]